jgi:[ribosomal protein S5]-alanine N-acetyltransferase
MKEIIISETERLTIRQVDVTDASFILELLNSEGWLKYIGDRKIYNLKEAENYILNRFIPPYKTIGFSFYLVQLKEEKTPVGICGLVKRDFLNDIDLGFAFLPEHNGKGYAFESSMAIMKFAKEKLNINRLLAFCNQDNERSVKLIKKLGMQFKGLIQLPDEESQCMLFGTY